MLVRTTLSLHDALPISRASLDVAHDKPYAEAASWVHGTAEELPALGADAAVMTGNVAQVFLTDEAWRSEEHTSELQSRGHLVCRLLLDKEIEVTHIIDT